MNSDTTPRATISELTDIEKAESGRDSYPSRVIPVHPLDVQDALIHYVRKCAIINSTYMF